MKAHLRFVVVFILVGQFLSLPVRAQPIPPQNVSLLVDKTTGAIVGPISAATFKSANAIGGGGSGTVTSVSVGNLSPIFTASVATATTTPAITYALTSQSANTFFAGPSSGGAAAPTYRAIVAGDLTGLNLSLSSVTTTLGFSAVGSLRYGRVTTATDYTPVGTDYLVSVTSTASPRVITLQAPAIFGGTSAASRFLLVKDESGGAGTNNITITPTSSTIDGAASKTISTNYGAIIIYCNGTEFFSVLVGGSSSGAPTDATYITQTANGSLSNEQAIGALSSGILRGATTTGVITSLGDILPAANGGTANGFTAFSGPTTSTKTFTLPNASAIILTDAAAVTVAQGGIGITSGTSGGVPYFSGSTTIASSGALAAGNIVVGGGAGAAPLTRPVSIDSSGNIVTGGNITGNILTINNATFGNVTTDTFTVTTSVDWGSSIVLGVNGGTGVANTGKTITLGGNLTTSGAFAITLTATGTTTVTLPTTGTLATLAGAESLTNKKLGSLTANGIVTTSSGDGTLSVTATVGSGNVVLSPGGVTVTTAKVLAATNNLTLSGTDGTTMTFPPASASVGYINIPQNSQSTAYTTVSADQGKHILHPTADNNARTFTIDSNANVPYPIGTAITVVNQINTVTISITSDTLTWYNGAGTGSTGSRTLASGGVAQLLKVGTTSWIITGPGVN